MVLALAVPSATQAASFTKPLVLPVGDDPVWIAAGHLDGDGDPDLVVANTSAHTVSVLAGAAGAGFQAAAPFAISGTNPKAVAIGDFDADGDPDLAVTSVPNTISILAGATGATFGAPSAVTVGGDLHEVAVAHFDGVGDPDLVVANASGQAASVLLGGAGLTFSTPAHFTAALHTRSVATADFNGDLDPDIVTANAGAGNLSVFLGEAGGGFGAATNIPTATNGPDVTPRVATADVNGDADPDLVVTGDGVVRVLLGGAGASFGTPAALDVGEGPGWVAVTDLNGDGDPDLAVANGYSNDVSVLLGAAGGSFGAATAFATGSGPNQLVAADVNADGDPDLAVVNALADTVSLLLNREHAPAAPTLSGTTPASPANNNAPLVTGQAAPGTTVRLYTTADCSGPPLAAGSAADFAAPGLAIPVPNDSTTTVRAIAVNAADVPSDCSTSSATFIEHSSPPGAVLSVAPNPVLTGAQVVYDASASTGFGISRHEWDLDGDGSFETDTGAVPTAARTFAAAAELQPSVRVSNDLGSTVTSAPLSVRLAPPAGAVGISVNAGAQFTNDPDVALTVVWPPFARTLALSNDGGFSAPTTRPVAALTPWSLDSSGNERLPKTVYLRFDGQTQTFADDIILDETAPTVTGASLVGGAGASAAAVKYRVRLRATDNAAGVKRYQVRGRRGKPARSRSLGKARRRVATTLVVRSGSKPRRIRVRDAAGNWSRWVGIM